MVRIGVLSDTHIDKAGQGIAFLNEVVDRFLGEVEMILHAGDVVDPDLLGAFPGRRVHAVRGNMDPPAPDLALRRIIDVNGFRIGLIHGWGAPEKIEDRVLKEFSSERIDCLVYGHSHYPVCHRRNGILLMNPGSPTDRRRAPRHTVGLLELDEEIRGRIIAID